MSVLLTASHDLSEHVQVYGRFIRSCGDIDGDHELDAAVMHYDLCRPAIRGVEVISVARWQSLSHFTVEACDFEWGGACTEDIDGDRNYELIVATPSNLPPIESFRIFKPKPRLVAYSLATGKERFSVRIERGRHAEGVPMIVGFIEDLDNDGIRECVLEYPFERLAVVSPGDGAVLYSVSTTSSTPASEDVQYIVPGVTCGDLDSDGITDLAVCDARVGVITLYSGKLGNPLRAITVNPEGPERELESARLFYARAVDGSGHPALLIGSPYEDSGRGVVRILDLQTGQRMLRWSLSPGLRCVTVGRAVTLIGDVDGDQLPEVVLGAIGEEPDSDRIYPGTVVILPSRNREDPILLSTPDARFLFGSSICALGDIGGNGSQDFLVAAPVMNVPGETKARGGIWALSYRRAE